MKRNSSLFTIFVLGCMARGKSTLVNALMRKRLLPFAEEYTITIINADTENYVGIAYDNEDKEIFIEDNLTRHTLEDWKKNDRIVSVCIYGRIPLFASIKQKSLSIVIPSYKERTVIYDMLADSEKSLVLFVMGADCLGAVDEMVLLNNVCNMGGKQSRDRYIFAINKMDVFTPEEESVEEALVKIKNKLENRGIFNPNIFPVSAQAALEARTKPTIQLVLSVYTQFVKHYPSTHYDAYYQFSHLPNLVRIDIDKYLNEAANNSDKTAGEYTNVEIHSGIVSIEKAIELHINKYNN